MFAQAGHTVQSLPEKNYCHSDTKKKKKRCKYQIAIVYHPFKVLTFPSGSFLPLLLYCYISPIPPSMMSPASIFPHPLLLYIFCQSPQHTPLPQRRGQEGEWPLSSSLNVILLAKGNNNHDMSQLSLCTLPDWPCLWEWPSWGRKRLDIFVPRSTISNSSNTLKKKNI